MLFFTGTLEKQRNACWFAHFYKHMWIFLKEKPVPPNIHQNLMKKSILLHHMAFGATYPHNMSMLGNDFQFPIWWYKCLGRSYGSWATFMKLDWDLTIFKVLTENVKNRCVPINFQKSRSRTTMRTAKKTYTTCWGIKNHYVILRYHAITSHQLPFGAKNSC